MPVTAVPLPLARSPAPSPRGIEKGRLRSRTPAQRQRGLAAQHLAHGEAQQALRALEGCDLEAVPDDLGIRGEVEQVAVFKVDEQQSGTRVHLQVAEGIEKVVAYKVRHRKRAVGVDAHKAALAAAVRHIHAVSAAALP